VLSAVACWRSGGAQDVRKLRREVEALRIKQREVAESIADAFAVAYGRSRERLQVAREHLRLQKTETVEGMEKQVQLAQYQLQSLARRLDEAAGSVKTVAFSTAQRIEEAIALRVRHLEACATLLQAKAKASRAQAAAAKDDFQRADELLADAADLLRSARETLGSDRDYDLQIDSMKQGLRAATAAVRARAQDTRSRLDRVLVDADRIVGALEPDETRTATSFRAEIGIGPTKARYLGPPASFRHRIHICSGGPDGAIGRVRRQMCDVRAVRCWRTLLVGLMQLRVE
jgi:hypothetical protein